MSESQQASEPLSPRQEQLDRHITARVDGLLRNLHERFGDQVREANQQLLSWLETQAPEIPPSFVDDFDISQLVEVPAPPEMPPEQDSVGELLAAVSEIDSETGQAEILTALLDQGLRFASHTAFFLIRQGQVRGWAGRGFEEDKTALFSGLAGEDPWAAMVAAGAAVALDASAAASVAERLGVTASGSALVVPFSIRGQISGALWAANDSGARLDAASLQLLTHAAAMALETAAVSPGVSPALKLVGELPAPESVSEPEPEALGLMSEPEVSEPEVTPVVEESEPALEESASEEPESELEPEEESVAVPEQDSVETSYEVEPSAFVAPAVETAVEADGVPEETAPVPVVDSAVEEAQTEYVPVEDDELASGDVAEGEDSAPEPEPYLPTEDEIALEAEPEPELEDTNIWELEEEEDDEEPTQVGMASQVARSSVPEPDPEPELAPEVAEPAPVVESAPVAEPAPATPPLQQAPMGQETVRIDLSTIQKDQAAAAAAEEASDPGDETSPTMHAVTNFAAPPAEPEPAPPSPAGFASSSPSSFVEPSQPAEAAPPPSFVSPPPEPEPPPEVKPEAPAGSTEVVPPPDLDGPGLAFATPEPAASSKRVDEGEAALHEEARRLARLLVSEIKLYNEEIIEEGRRGGNIYERLKDDIDRSRQMYEERIDPRLADQEDYFYQELVQRLAGGEERLLGM